MSLISQPASQRKTRGGGGGSWAAEEKTLCSRRHRPGRPAARPASWRPGAGTQRCAPRTPSLPSFLPLPPRTFCNPRSAVPLPPALGPVPSALPRPCCSLEIASHSWVASRAGGVPGLPAVGLPAGGPPFHASCSIQHSRTGPLCVCPTSKISFCASFLMPPGVVVVWGRRAALRSAGRCRRCIGVVFPAQHPRRCVLSFSPGCDSLFLLPPCHLLQNCSCSAL